MSTTVTAAVTKQQLEVGDIVSDRELLNIHGETVQIPDPERMVHLQFRRYAEFGVEGKMSPFAALDPRSWLAAGRALTQAPSLHGATGKGEDHMGLPADLLIGTDGKVIAVKYGKRVDDQWSVDELLGLARRR